LIKLEQCGRVVSRRAGTPHQIGSGATISPLGGSGVGGLGAIVAPRGQEAGGPRAWGAPVPIAQWGAQARDDPRYLVVGVATKPRWPTSV
jgi:hypothetical protein